MLTGLQTGVLTIRLQEMDQTKDYRSEEDVEEDWRT